MTKIARPCVSVVIPVRDRLDLLKRALQSVDNQTMGDIEIVVVDDGSDEPIRATSLDCRFPIHVVRNPQSLGAQRSRLIGARHATGAYVALLDSDDWWNPAKLAAQLEAAIENPDAVVACRVVAARGTLRKDAPWRPMRAGERVEDFLYVSRGMLQTSTVFAARDTVVNLLESSAESRVHNDTMLFLEAQGRGFPILQLAQPLSFFDDNPRPDRVSYDLGRVQASEEWFRAVSHDWSIEARRGFMLTDMVTRYVNTGQRGKAIGCLFRAYHPKLGLKQYLKKTAYVIFNGSPLRFLGALQLCLLALH
ncbi:glycosyltransferase family 2 protein [Lichenifustis flavocetrariae]|uniref:Glycosyltransferase n=1 Tax=Lichenifustis flavocetrariae TaxID=2949735 RepID=A0AA41Z2G1_9HYPH|nr:glycosyltransferase family 2 protein [Lichenifustis flavocetrariae]MCW6511595.1 glycosyltransferase [Lichenifustis flavocetrariae]